jgi:glycosyltransferase involved in cell wall biosynthesis
MQVSVLSLVYNHEPYLDDFFHGLLSQEHPYEWEIVIGIDLCSDHSIDICKKYRDQYPELIRLIIHEDRVGIIPNFIATYNACSGKYIAMCEGDDWWIDSRKILKQVQSLEGDPKAMLSFTDIKVLDEDENKYHPNWATITKERYCLKDIIKANPITTCSVMFRNHRISISDNSFKDLHMADWPLYIELLTHGNAKYLTDTTAVYRRSMHGSFAKNPVLEKLQKKISVLEYLMAQPPMILHRQLLQNEWFNHAYAIAIRLPKEDERRNDYLDNILKNEFFYHISLSLKALFHRYLK